MVIKYYLVSIRADHIQKSVSQCFRAMNYIMPLAVSCEPKSQKCVKTRTWIGIVF